MIWTIPLSHQSGIWLKTLCKMATKKNHRWWALKFRGLSNLWIEFIGSGEGSRLMLMALSIDLQGMTLGVYLHWKMPTDRGISTNGCNRITQEFKICFIKGQLGSFRINRSAQEFKKDLPTEILKLSSNWLKLGSIWAQFSMFNRDQARGDLGFILKTSQQKAFKVWEEVKHPLSCREGMIFGWLEILGTKGESPISSTLASLVK